MALSAKLVSQMGPKGFQGSTIRYGSGAPTQYTTANEGDLYFDFTNSVWYGPRTGAHWAVLVASSAGFQGPPGSYTLGQAALSVGTTGGSGPQAGLAGFSRLTTATPLPVVGESVACDYVPGINTALHSAFLQNATGGAGSLTFTLYNASTSTSVYTTASVAAGASLFVGIFGTSTYPLTAGYRYQWLANPSTSGNYCCVVTPSYWELGQAGQSLNRAMPACIPSATLIPNTSTALYIPGSNSLNAFIRPYTAGYLYSGVIVNGSSQAASCTLNAYSVTAAANATTTFGPLSMTTCTLGAGASNWVVSGGGTGGLVIDSWYVC